MTANRITSAAYAIVSTRDLCGNEREALRDWIDDNGPLTAAERAEVWAEVARLWGESQRNAGVVLPVSPDERRAICRVLERAP